MGLWFNSNMLLATCFCGLLNYNTDMMKMGENYKLSLCLSFFSCHGSMRFSHVATHNFELLLIGIVQVLSIHS